MQFSSCFDQDSAQPLQTFYIVSSTISLVASTTVLITFLLLPALRLNKNLRLIAYLTSSNIILALAILDYTLGYWRSDSAEPPSRVLAVFQLYGTLGVTGWALIFGVQLHCIITNRDRMDEKVLLLVGLVVPWVPALLLGLPIFSSEVVGQVELVIYGLMVMYLVFVYAKIVIGAKKTMNQESANRLIQQIVYYPVVLCINLILQVVADVIMLESDCLTIGAAILNGAWCLQGLVDALLYGNNVIVREEIKAYWKRRGSAQNNENALMSKDGG